MRYDFLNLLEQNLLGDGSKQTALAGALDGNGQHALVHCAGAGDATWQDFTAVGQEALEQVDVFVIDKRNFVFTKITLFSGAFHLILLEESNRGINVIRPKGDDRSLFMSGGKSQAQTARDTFIQQTKREC